MTSPWRCLARAAVAVAAGALARAEPGAIELTADAAGAGRPLPHAWSQVVGGGRAADGLRAAWLDALHTAASECGFVSVRLEGLFAEDGGAAHPRDGRPADTFPYLDDVFDRLLIQNVRPLLVVDPAAGGGPAWPALVEALLRHCEERYSQSEVRRWRLEIGGPGDFYARTAAAARRVDPQIKVGGPGADGSDGAALAAFLRRIHELGAPLDFVALRAFPFPNAPDDLLRRDLQAARRVLAASAFPRAALEVTAWGSSDLACDYTRDVLPEGAWILKSNLEAAGLAEAVAFRDFTDAGGGATLFHGGAGLITYPGVVKPSFHAYRYLNALGDEAIAQVPGGIVTRRGSSRRLIVLAYNFPVEQTTALPRSATLGEAERLTASGSPRPLSIHLTGLRPGGQVVIESVDRRHGNATAAWQEMGGSAAPSRSALDDLRSAARAVSVEYAQADDLGHFQLTRTLGPWSMLLLRQL